MHAREREDRERRLVQTLGAEVNYAARTVGRDDYVLHPDAEKIMQVFRLMLLRAHRDQPRFIQAPRTVQVCGFLRMRERTDWQPRKGWGMICTGLGARKWSLK